MKFPAVLPLLVTGLSLCAQPAPPSQTPAQPVPPPTATGPDGVTVPVQITPPAPTLPPDRVVLTVGDVKITARILDQILDAYSENQRVFVNGPGRQQFIDQLIRVFVLEQEGKRRKLDQTDRYKNQLTFSAAGILSSHTEEDIRKSVKIDDEMLRAYMNRHRPEYMQLRARMILVRMQGSPVPVQPGAKDLTDAEALAKVEDLRKQIEGGADFAKLASEQSDDPVSRPANGELGFFKRGQLAPSFEEAAFGLKTGELSKPVKSAAGYSLIQVEEEKPVKPFEELRAELERNVRIEESRKYIDNLKALVHIEVDPEFASPAHAVTTVKP